MDSNKTNYAIHWIVIYPVDSVIHPLNNWAVKFTKLTSTHNYFSYEQSFLPACFVFKINFFENSMELPEKFSWLSFVKRVQAPKLKAGIHLKAVFTPPKIGLTKISRSRFKQYKNPTLISQTNVLGCFVNFLVIFRYIWEEMVFLKRVVKFGEIRNS